MEHTLNATLTLIVLLSVVWSLLVLAYAVLDGALESTVSLPDDTVSAQTTIVYRAPDGRWFVDCEASDLAFDRAAKLDALFDALCVDFDDECLPAYKGWY